MCLRHIATTRDAGLRHCCVCGQLQLSDAVLEAVGNIFGVDGDGDLPPSVKDMPQMGQQILAHFVLGAVPEETLLQWCRSSSTMKALG